MARELGWLELKLLLMAVGGEGEENREGGGEWRARKDKGALWELIPVVALSWGHWGVPRRSRRWRGPPWSISPVPEGTGKGLRLDEAMHPLTLMTVGVYGKALPPQNGAPVRLIVPWKYGLDRKSVV